MPEINLEGSKIMIVDDTPQNLGVLEKMLIGKGYYIFAMTGGDTALKVAEKTPPDLFLLDVNMPGMNGYQLCEKIKKSPALCEIPVVFLSGMNETEDKIKGFEAGGFDYITKPFQLDEVEARVKTHLTIHKLRLELKKHNANLESLVAERTHELDMAYKRLKSLERIKSEFLSMISHELRTPLNGVLVVSELIIQERVKYGQKDDDITEIYASSRNRIERLLDDAMMINELDASSKSVNQTSFKLDSFMEGRCARVDLLLEAGKEIPQLRGDEALLKKAMDNLLQTAACFNSNKETVEVRAEVSGGALNLIFPLDALRLSADHAERFFELASTSRQSSAAQSLALAPVVAEKIFRLFGGTLKMDKLDGTRGRIVLGFPAGQ